MKKLYLKIIDFVETDILKKKKIVITQGYYSMITS
jgi:hypothetical protein